MPTIKEKLQAEIDRANAITSKQDTTVHSAITSLIDGYGGQSGLKNYLENATYIHGYISSSGTIYDDQSAQELTSEIIDVGDITTIFWYHFINNGTSNKWIAIAEYDENDVFQKRNLLISGLSSGGNCDVLKLTYHKIRISFRTYNCDSYQAVFNLDDIVKTHW